MNKLSTERRAQILGMMVEGNSVRAIVRMTGASKNTIIKLLEDAGEAFSAYQDRVFHDLPCKRIQLDEIWAYSYCKQRKVPFAKNAPEEAGDLWTWVAIDADTKLVPSWRVGDRSGATAIEFVCDLSKRLANRVQVTSDGHRAYLEAVEAGFGADVDYAQLYGEVPHPAGRYSPAQIQGTKTFCLYRQPRTSAYFDELCRAPEPYNADEHEAVHAADKRLFKEGREPRAFGGNSLHALQLRSHPSEPTGHTRNGVRSHAEALVVDRHGAGH
jgi:hypothetical protein